MADNIESRMNFIVEQQAQFTVDIQLLKERQADAQRMIEANGNMIRQLVDVTMSLANHGEEIDRRLEETDKLLRASGRETDRRMQETDRRLKELGEETDRRMQETDRRLKALIRTVESLTRRNGPPRKSRS